MLLLSIIPCTVFPDLVQSRFSLVNHYLCCLCFQLNHSLFFRRSFLFVPGHSPAVAAATAAAAAAADAAAEAATEVNDEVSSAVDDVKDENTSKTKKKSATQRMLERLNGLDQVTQALNRKQSNQRKYLDTSALSSLHGRSRVRVKMLKLNANMYVFCVYKYLDIAALSSLHGS
jgi:hypothetical protein